MKYLFIRTQTTKKKYNPFLYLIQRGKFNLGIKLLDVLSINKDKDFTGDTPSSILFSKLDLSLYYIQKANLLLKY